MKKNRQDQITSPLFSRREFIKNSMLAAGASSVLSAAGSASVKAATTPNKLSLIVSGYKLDRVEALIDGRVQVEGCDIKFEPLGIGDINTNVFSGPQTLDVTEIGLHPFMLAYANDGFREYSLLPIFPLRVFRHKSIFIRTDRGIKGPEDLRGKKVATPGFSSTSLTWLRGIVQHEYGVKPEEIQWVQSSKDSSAKAAGKVSKQESMVPKGLSVSKGPEGKDESDLLESGDVDALFHAAEPRAYVEGHPKVARLFPDFRKTERSYYKKTGIFPIMHAVVIRNTLVDQHPWLAKAVFDAYSKAKIMMYGHLRKVGWATISLPWVAQEIEETRALMGDNFWPYGIAPNRKALEALFQYSHEQGLATRRLTIEELFHPSSLEFMEN
ncbi:MAG: ABC transporter substrate-binding protein [Desulfobacteraceae bacterium]|jgi:4,5-dihydroxyphthalate decarboxylase|nr:ABC transporter substrate-binding protein [Desulfobacteraceae bacterium]